jgi:hypothetical protein
MWIKALSILLFLIINEVVINIEKLSINNLDEVLKIIHYFSVKKIDKVLIKKVILG